MHFWRNFSLFFESLMWLWFGVDFNLKELKKKKTQMNANKSNRVSK